MTIKIICGAPEFGEDGFDEVLGFGAGDEDGGSDAKGEAEELLLAGDVLDGFVGEAAGDGGVVGGLLLRCEDAVRVGVELGAVDAEGVEQKGEGVAGGGFAQVRQGLEPVNPLREGLGESAG